MNNQAEENQHSSILKFPIAEPEKMIRKNSTFVDLEQAKREADILLSGENTDNELKKNLLFEEKSVSIFHLYTNLSQPINYLFMILGTIGCIGAGISMPIMAYLSSEVFSDIGNTSENISEEDIQKMKEIV